jgi:hypothetical protein
MKTVKPTREEARFSPLLPAEDSTTGRDYVVRAKVWRWKGGSWHFVTLPAKQSAEIRRRFGAGARGWGSIRVSIRIGDTQWQTSLFPTSKNKEYLFAIKAGVRKAEDIGAGDRITAVVSIAA